MPADDPGHLASSIRHDRIERARRMTFAQKFLAGGDLFDAACEITKAGIRHQRPHLTESQLLSESTS